ncbi:MAG: hypothetical protein JJU00_13110 [Opitutales bacterium]|nr:hypothetical protein [Opitutales bacterium]
MPALLDGVPRGEIKGDGPFMVNFTGTVGSFEAGNLRFISVFARSEDGLEWTDATTDVLTNQGSLTYIPPWFSKDRLVVSDGTAITDTYVSLDGVDWELFRPEGHVRVAASAVRETHRVGHHGNRIYVFDQVAPLPAPDVTATDGRGGVHLSWSAINGADYYVAVLANRTLRTDDTELFIPSGPGESAAVSHRIDARVYAVAPDRHPGLSSEPVSATAYRGDLPSPTPPEDVSFTRQLFTNAFILSWRASGGTAIHEVAWSPAMDGAQRETIGRFQVSNIILPVEIIPPCSTVYLWVRGSDGIDTSAWSEPLALSTMDGARPCPPGDFSVTIGEDGEHFRMTWSAVPHASRYQIERRRASGDSTVFELIAEPALGWAADADAFFDTTYHYRIRARLVQPFLEPVYSAWSQPFAISRPPSERESLSLALLGWESLGDGRFMAEDMGGLHIVEEGSDWIRLDEGWQLFIGDVDEHLNLAIHIPHGEIGWAMMPIGMWPYLWSVLHGNWIWAPPGGQWIWDFQRARWWGNGAPFE